MKAVFIISLFSASLFANGIQVIDSITNALKSGNTTEMNKYFAGSVDVTILGFQDFLDKKTTIQKVNSFFSKKSIIGYDVIHEGKSKGKDSVFTIGTLKTEQGNYKIYMFISTLNGKYLIEEIKIES